jgi:hypothetical protein
LMQRDGPKNSVCHNCVREINVTRGLPESPRSGDIICQTEPN